MCTISYNTVRSDNVIRLDENSSIPIYQQVYDGLLDLIVKNVLSEGEKLPSVREFALLLKINPNTIQKAYKSLEKDGYIKSEKGKGNFVSEHDKFMDSYLDELNQKLQEVIKELISAGEKKEDIEARIFNILEGLK